MTHDAGEIPLRITPEMLLSRRVDFERRMSRVPSVTLGTLAVLALVFAGEMVTAAFDSPGGMIAAGAVSRAAVGAGEVWRLVTAVFLHGGVDHLLSNAIALYIVGMVCEHAFGRAQIVVLFVGSGVAGFVLSVLVGPGPSVGASGAIFGLTAAGIVLFRQYRERLLLRDRRIGLVLLAWAVYTIAVGAVTPFVDNAAHVGGAVSGALIARHLHPVVLDPMSPDRAATVRRLLYVTTAVVLWAALTWATR